MHRRTFLATSSLAPLARAAETEQPKNAFYHLVYYYMRNGSQVDRTTQYLQKVWMPAAQRAGIGPVGPRRTSAFHPFARQLSLLFGDRGLAQ